MSSVAQKPKVGGLLSTLLELALSIGGYYLLRAFGVGVFWALTAPAVAVAVVVVVVTARRRRLDMIGLLVLVELVATLTFSLVTRSARVAALREPVYVLVGGVFCLVTLLRRAPLTHLTTSAMATFGDPKRERAFELAWQEVPRYRMWQRLLTTSFGSIMVVAAVVRAYVLLRAPDDRLAAAVDVSNVIGLVMIGALVVTSAVLIQPAKKIIERLLERM
ncbi:VC0807 family protein [Actinophytocola sp.]|uniref:VC0807 family protein n=1 Tax=Actinophytocola sp. TaxID=1872138 RepID=UPI00389AFF09